MNLENFKVQKLKKNEMISTQGGLDPFTAFAAVTGAVVAYVKAVDLIHEAGESVGESIGRAYNN